MKTKHDFLLYLCVVMGLCMTITNTSAQDSRSSQDSLLPTQSEFLDSLYSSTGGDSWRDGATGATYTIEQLIERGVVSSTGTLQS